MDVPLLATWLAFACMMLVIFVVGAAPVAGPAIWAMHHDRFGVGVSVLAVGVFLWISLCAILMTFCVVPAILTLFGLPL